MPAEAIDSNVVLYLIGADPAKAATAEAMLKRKPIVSVQLLNEVASVARRKARLTWPELHALLALVERHATVTDLSATTHRTGLRLAERYRLAIYDAMIVAAALEAGCDTLWSEDMQDGLRVDDGLTIRNPFRPDIGASA